MAPYTVIYYYYYYYFMQNLLSFLAVLHISAIHTVSKCVDAKIYFLRKVPDKFSPLTTVSVYNREKQELNHLHKNSMWWHCGQQ